MARLTPTSVTLWPKMLPTLVQGAVDSLLPCHCRCWVVPKRLWRFPMRYGQCRHNMVRWTRLARPRTRRRLSLHSHCTLLHQM